MQSIGDTVWWAPDGGREHRYIALTDPGQGRFVVANLTESKGGKFAYTIKAGQHGCTKDSDVNFGDSFIADRDEVLRKIRYGQITEGQPMAVAEVRKIALFGSTHVAPSGHVKKMLIKQWS